MDNSIGFGPQKGPDPPPAETGPVLHVGPEAPTGSEVFWLDTDDTC